MINIIKSELYKNLKRKYFYIISAIILLVSLSLPITYKYLVGEFTLEYVQDLLSLFNSFLMFLPLFSILFAGILSEEYTEKTLKNVIPYNISKLKYFFGKFLVQIIFLIFIYLLLLLGFILSLYFVTGDNISINSGVLDTTKRFLCSIPCFIYSLAIINLLVVTFRKETIVYLIYLIFFAQLPLLMMSISQSLPTWFKDIEKYIILMTIKPLTNPTVTSADLWFSVISGFLYIIFFSFITYFIFSKEEIK